MCVLKGSRVWRSFNIHSLQLRFWHHHTCYTYMIFSPYILLQTFHEWLHVPFLITGNDKLPSVFVVIIHSVCSVCSSFKNSRYMKTVSLPYPLLCTAYWYKKHLQDTAFSFYCAFLCRVYYIKETYCLTYVIEKYTI